MGECVSKLWLYFSIPYSDWVDNELNKSPQVKSFLLVTVTDLSLSLSRPMSLVLHFLSPIQVRSSVTE